MLELIVVVSTLIAFIIGLFSVLIFWGHDAELESYYKETVVKGISKPGYLPKSIVEIPEEIIVDSHRSHSPIRTYLKKQIAKLLGKEVPPVILVFENYSEEEQKAFLIEKAFSSSVESTLLDLAFLETLVHYLAYKYASENSDIDQRVERVLRRYFEGSKYRDCILKLDSFDYSATIVLNPPPIKKPLLTNVVLPMVREKEKNLIALTARLPEIEEWKSVFMEIIDDLCSKKCGVLFVGIKTKVEYTEMLIEVIEDCSSLIVSARGSHIQDMTQVIGSCCLLEMSKPVEEQIITACERRDIQGTWEFPEEETMNCRWVIFRKT